MTSNDELPEITPQKISDEIEVVLSVATNAREGWLPFVMAHIATGSSTAEQSARNTLTNAGSSYRFAGLVRVRVPRALLKERWTDEQDAS